MIATEIKTLHYSVNGQAQPSQSGQYFDVFDPSTGDVVARAPRCTAEEVNLAVQAAKDAFPAWADTPPAKRVQVLYRFRELIERHLDELTLSVCTENGKNLE